MMVYIAEKMTLPLPEHIKIFSVLLNETSNSFAEWYASDNESSKFHCPRFQVNPHD